ncbi:uncharacterized protein FOKN1_1313 [Thiohalobacter thiocyanaticus]|uniref:Chromate resistance protein n=1 Tax=Thiohalobacter thiocyanaticus TaxID=585455 RepID=A0A1Z4VQ27_9GAMM|nr:chromate resistance protein ChrB domain-containing protein [Thiohalobacter thiocyanaticus]BAZ93711.1 uncharacterized protein FOKN1_1313 [Thiohalobacter thiocyanaticus]
MRLWRALRELGAATLRDGASLMPYSQPYQASLETLCSGVIADGGTAWLFELAEQAAPVEKEMQSLFDRTETYHELVAQLSNLQHETQHSDEVTARRHLRQAERQLEAIARIDFFPGEAYARARQALQELTDLINRIFSPREPLMESGCIEHRDIKAYSGRTWATRRNLWIDRVASAWLIRRFIDAEARFVWLQRPEDCPDEALGFDFDGAVFTHVADKVTFEVLQTSFGFDQDPGLQGLGRLVHYLDVGGRPVPEAGGFEAVLAGLRGSAPDDDALLDSATLVLDALYRHYTGR